MLNFDSNSIPPNSDWNAFLLPLGPYMSTPWFKSRLAIVSSSPGSPSMWSPCQWLIRILCTFASDIPQILICLCVPSAQSNSMPSPLNSRYIALGLRSLVGIMQDVPKKVSCMVILLV